jgi:hypothetical protein
VVERHGPVVDGHVHDLGVRDADGLDQILHGPRLEDLDVHLTATGRARQPPQVTVEHDRGVHAPKVGHVDSMERM